MDRGTQANTDGSVEVITEAPTTSNGLTNNELVSIMIIIFLSYHYYKNITNKVDKSNFLAVRILKKEQF